MKIMIIEDDAGLTAEIVSFLEKWGYEAAAIKDFQHILEQFTDEQPQLPVYAGRTPEETRRALKRNRWLNGPETRPISHSRSASWGRPSPTSTRTRL